jgi:hypothetical protein
MLDGQRDMPRVDSVDRVEDALEPEFGDKLSGGQPAIKACFLVSSRSIPVAQGRERAVGATCQDVVYAVRGGNNHFGMHKTLVLGREKLFVECLDFADLNGGSLGQRIDRK